jgi:putative NADH-flavin reductase
MKIVLFSPTSEISAIAQTSKVLVEEMSKRGHEIVIVSSESFKLGNPQIEFNCKEILQNSESERVQEVLFVADAICYQVGNNYDFHGGLLPYLAAHPGVVILHDFCLPDLFQG